MKNPVAAAGAFLTVLVLVIVAWVFLSPGFAKTQIETYVAQTTGRKLEIKGGSSLVFRPRLAVRLTDVTLSNPEGQGGALVKAPAVVLPIEWRDLFSRQLRAGAMTLEQPVFNLTNDAAGRASWTDPAMPASTENRVLSFEAEGGVINYLNEKTGLAFAVQDANFEATLAQNDELAARGTASLNGRFVNFQAYVKSLGRAAGEGSPAELDIDLAGAKIGFSGRLISHNDLLLAGQLSMSADETRDLAKWLGAALPGQDNLGRFSLTAKLDSTNGLLSLADADLAIGGNALKGKLTVDAWRARPKLSGALATDQLNLPVPVLGTNGAVLKAFDTSLELDAFRLKVGPFEASPAKLGLEMNEGLLDLSLRDAGFAGGKLSGTLSINGSRPVPAIQMVVDATAIASSELASAAGVQLPNGPLTVKTSLTASGKSTDELIGTLSGSADLSMPGGVLQGLDLKAMLVRLNTAVVDGWPKIGDTGFGSLAATFQIADGIASMKSFALSGADFTMTGTGEIDLLRRALELKFDPKLGAEGDPVKIAVTGKWDAPRFRAMPQTGN